MDLCYVLFGDTNPCYIDVKTSAQRDPPRSELLLCEVIWNFQYRIQHWLSMESFSYPDRSDVPPTSLPYNLDHYPLQKTLIAILICLIAVTGTVGNIFVVVAVGTFKKLRSVTNAFITSLAVCNFIICFTSPYHVVTILRDFPPKLVGFCVAVASILISTQVVSLLTLTLIAVNRALLVRARRRVVNLIYTKRNVATMIAFSWILPALVVTVASLVDFATLGYNVKYKTCIVTSDKSGIASLVAGVVIGIPSLLIIVVCYSAIFFYSRDHHKQARRSLSGEAIIEASRHIARMEGNVENNSINSQTPQSPSRHKDGNLNDVTVNTATTGNTSAGASTLKRRKTRTERVMINRQNKITRNLFLIVCVFALCVMPFCVAVILPTANALIPWFAVLLLSNSAVNPILYGVLHPQFKRAFMVMLHFKSRKSDLGKSLNMSSFDSASPRKRNSSLLKHSRPDPKVVRNISKELL